MKFWLVSVLSRPFVSTQFKLGIYQLRQITRIEEGGIVISCSDSRYQPDGGIRHELSPDEWFIYSWCFFPRYYGQYSCDEASLLRECYYDYFAKTRHTRQSNIYSIFKNGHRTGYIIVEHFGQNHLGENRGNFYSGMHINEWGISNYKRVFDSGEVKPIEYTRSPVEAAICMLADHDDFEKAKIDLASLQKDCEASPDSYTLHLKLTKLLQKCKHADLYLEK